MTKYSKASDSLVNVVDANGKAHKVTQRAFDVVYVHQGYKLSDGEVEVVNDPEEVDYFQSSREELEAVKNDDLKAFLDKEEIEFDAKAKKEDLIDLILGE
ncbi:hypothetical protein [Sporosarcina sp. SAFN-010]|uniref:hypothetical protein n=1 Tax=Sporosarcina sp. SAFN-010 TaxID=3387273 RepID=UPI003F7F56F8